MNDQKTALDCFRLWEIGVDEIPAIAEKYATISGTVGHTYSDRTPFDRRVESGDCVAADGELPLVSEPGPVYPAFMAVRDVLQRAFADTATNLYALGSAVQFAAWEYADSDELTGGVIDELKERIVDGIEDGAYTPHDEGFNVDEYAQQPSSVDDIPQGDYVQPEYPDAADGSTGGNGS